MIFSRLRVVWSLLVILGACHAPEESAAPDAGGPTVRIAVTPEGNGQGTIVSSPPGIDCGASCAAEFPEGVRVTLQPKANPDTTFVGWGGACSGMGPCEVTGSQQVVAMFALQRSLVVTRSGAGTGTVASSPTAIACGSDCTEVFLLPTTLGLTATPAAGSRFAGWVGGCTGSSAACSLTLGLDPVGVNATFELAAYDLVVTPTGTGGGLVSSVPMGISCGADCIEPFAHGATITLSATPDASSTFAGWSGACSGTGTCSVTMTAAQTVTPTFTRVTHDLTVTKAGTGAGRIAGTGIDCGSDCSETFTRGATATLVASADAGSTFAGWSGACSGTGTCTVAMSAAQTVIATFTRESHLLEVVKVGTGSGKIVATGIDCGSDCSEAVLHGTTVTLTASPDPGSTFEWQTACTGATCDVTVVGDVQVFGRFTLSEHTLTVSVVGDGTNSRVAIDGTTCTGLCSKNYNYGATATLVATPSDATFLGWSGGGCFGTDFTCTVAIDAAKSVIARFEHRRVLLSINKGGTGSGTVVSSPGGINCGFACQTQVPTNTPIVLIANADAGSAFASWSGGGGICDFATGNTCTVSLAVATTLTANFVRMRSLTVSRSGSGTGRVTGPGIDCGTDCAESVVQGLSLHLTATADAGSVVSAWTVSSGTIVSGCFNGPTCTVRADFDDVSVKAHFTPSP